MSAQPPGDTHTPDQWHHHLNQLNAIHTRWQAGQINTEWKRKLIAAENARYHGAGHHGRTGQDITTTTGRKPAS